MKPTQMSLLEEPSFSASASASASAPIPHSTCEPDLSSKTAQKNSQVLSVSALNKLIRGQLEKGFSLIWLKGEISNFKPHSSGHWYFSLKDSQAQISAIMFRGFNQSVQFRPQDGREVIVRGKITVYEPRGNYQIFCELMEPLGAGALQIAFEKLKARLQAEGLFSADRKKPLPVLPQHVAVVTSPTGAAFRDILQVLNRRFKGLRITLVPTVVQGDQAPAAIAKAIELANRLPDVDVLIVGRGGGSLEDLWCFNDEKVARALAKSVIPTVSAVGHEIDFTIADFVADVRAPTPSAAAEIIVKSAFELMEKLNLRQNNLVRLWRHQLELYSKKVLHLHARLEDPQRRLVDLAQRCDDLQNRLILAAQFYQTTLRQKLTLVQYRLGSPMELIFRCRQKILDLETQLRGETQLRLERTRARLTQSCAVLDSLSPLRVLERGYSITYHESQVVRSAQQVSSGDRLVTKVSQGEILSVVQ